MGKDADEIRHDIEDIRSRLGETVKNVVSETAARIAEAAPSKEELRRGANRVETLIKENPVGVAIGSVAVGFLMGLLLPKTSIETERINDAKRKAVDAGKQMVRETVSMTLKGVRSPDL